MAQYFRSRCPWTETRGEDDERSRHILVVDDEPQIRRVLRSTLSSHGYVIRRRRPAKKPSKRCARNGRTSSCSTSTCREWEASRRPRDSRNVRCADHYAYGAQRGARQSISLSMRARTIMWSNHLELKSCWRESGLRCGDSHRETRCPRFGKKLRWILKAGR